VSDIEARIKALRQDVRKYAAADRNLFLLIGVDPYMELVTSLGCTHLQSYDMMPIVQLKQEAWRDFLMVMPENELALLLIATHDEYWMGRGDA
jgi:hypothetical protein